MLYNSQKTINSSDFHSSFLALRDKINAREVDLSVKHYVIVPDKCSIFVEGILFKEGGAFDVEVLSFERLELKFNKGQVKSLPSVGAVMLIKQILFDFKGRLQVFKKSAEHKGLAEKLYDAICACSDCGLTPNDLRLSEVGASGKKLADIALVWDEFLIRTKGKFLDTAGKMRLLLSELKSADLKNINFYIAGFDRFNANEKEILKVLENKANSFSFFSVDGSKEIFGEVEFFEGAELATRVKKIAQHIRNDFINDGVSPSDFCVIADPNDYAAIERIFNEYDIPYYIDKKLLLGETELYKFLTACYSAGLSYRREDILAFSQNFYFGLEADGYAIFENYCLEHAVNFKDFSTPFTKRVDKKEDKEWRKYEEETAEKVRQKVTEFLNWFSIESAKTNTPKKFTEFVKILLQKIDADKKTKILGELIGLELSTALDKFIDIAALLSEINIKPSDSNGFKRLFKLYTEGVASCQATLMPAFSNTVMIGAPTSFRGGKFKKIFVTTFCEGFCPSLIGDTALISLGDITSLKHHGKSFYPSPKELNKYSLDETLRLFNLADSLFLAYSNSGNFRISGLERVIKRGAKKVIKSDDSPKVTTRHEALTLLASDADCGSKNDFKTLFTKDELDKLTSKSLIPKTLLPKAGEIFFKENTVSISRVQRYFNCPYKNFVESVLGLTERHTGEVKPIEVGSFLHKAVENFVKNGGEFLNPNAQMRSEIKKLVDGNGEYAWLKDKNMPLLKRVSVELLRIAEPIANTLTKGNFKNKWVEKSFGVLNADTLKTIKFNQKTSLRGVIDRIDVVDYNGETYARVIDYKSGGGLKTHGDIRRDTYYGLGLQLPLYGKILKENGFRLAGLFYFLLSAGFSDDAKKTKLKGFFLDEEHMWPLFDTDLTDYPSKSSIMDITRNSKGGALHGSWSKPYALNEAELNGLGDYALQLVNGALAEIGGGFIKPLPWKLGQRTACDYCKANTFCGISQESSAFRELERIDKL